MTFAKHLSMVVTLSLTLAGCTKVELPAAPESAAPRTTATRPKPRSQPTRAVTDEEAKQFAQELTKAVLDQDEPTFNCLVNWRAMADKALSGLGAPAAIQEDLASGLVEGATRPGKFVASLYQGGSARYEFTRVEEVSGQKYVWFRMLSDAGVNFHRYALRKTGDDIHAVELYILLSGENISDSWRRLMLPVVKEQNKNWLQKLTANESELVNHMDEVRGLTQQVREKDFAGAMATYHSMPESMQKDRFVMLLRCQAAGGLGESEIIAAGEAFRAAHPEAKGIEMLMVDVYFAQKNYGEALACLERAQQGIGRDSYLQFLAATILAEQGDPTQAIERLNEATTISPVAIETFQLLVQLLLEQEDFAATADALTRYDELFDIHLGELQATAQFQAFAESPEGQTWLEQHN